MAALSLRLRLLLLVAGTMLPLILFAAGIVFLNYTRDRDAAFDRVLETVRGMRIAIDAEMQGITLALQVLADAQALQRDDLDGFRRNTEAFLRRFPEGSSISLADATGRHVFYDPDGRSLRKSFLKSPLEFSRITSGFTWARPHPILGGVRPHLACEHNSAHTSDRVPLPMAQHSER